MKLPSIFIWFLVLGFFLADKGQTTDEVHVERWVEIINNLCLQKQTLEASLTVWGTGLGAVCVISKVLVFLPLKALYLALRSLSYFSWIS